MNLSVAQELQARGWVVRLAVLFDRCRVIGDQDCQGLDLTRLGHPRFTGKIQALRQLVPLVRAADIVIGGVECAATMYGDLAVVKTLLLDRIEWLVIACLGTAEIIVAPLTHAAMQAYQGHERIRRAARMVLAPVVPRFALY